MASSKEVWLATITGLSEDLVALPGKRFTVIHQKPKHQSVNRAINRMGYTAQERHGLCGSGWSGCSSKGGVFCWCPGCPCSRSRSSCVARATGMLAWVAQQRSKQEQNGGTSTKINSTNRTGKRTIPTHPITTLHHVGRSWMDVFAKGSTTRAIVVTSCSCSSGSSNFSDWSLRFMVPMGMKADYTWCSKTVSGKPFVLYAVKCRASRAGLLLVRKIVTPAEGHPLFPQIFGVSLG